MSFNSLLMSQELWVIWDVRWTMDLWYEEDRLETWVVSLQFPRGNFSSLWKPSLSRTSTWLVFLGTCFVQKKGVQKSCNPFYNTLPGSKGRMTNSRWDMLMDRRVLPTHGFSNFFHDFQWPSSPCEANSSETNPLWAKLLQRAAAVVTCRNWTNMAPETDQCSLQRGRSGPKRKGSSWKHTVFRGHVSFWSKRLIAIPYSHPLFGCLTWNLTMKPWKSEIPNFKNINCWSMLKVECVQP